MILINLLPPELRRSRSGANPVVLGLTAGALVAVALLVCYLWVGIRITTANEVLTTKNDLLTATKARADKVRNLEKEIDSDRERRNQLVGLLAHKVFWARTLDDFATLLNGPWQAPATFDVRCQELSINESPGAGSRGDTDDTISFAVDWHYKLIGKERSLAGDYLNSFFNTIKDSRFWSAQGFMGKPADSYHGDQPRVNPAIQRMIIEGSLEWQRVKVIKISSDTAVTAGR